MRVLVIGGTSFIGPQVVWRLVADGHEVIVFHRGRTHARLPPRVRHIHGDRREFAAHAGTFREFAPDAVLHMIAMNERDAEVAVRAFRGVSPRLVTVSSADVYRAFGRLLGVEDSPPDPLPLSEGAPLRSVLHPYRSVAAAPDHPLYDYDKIPVERVVLGATGIAGTVLRLPFVYGPSDPQNRLFGHLRRMDAGRPVIPVEERQGEWRATRGYVDNVAAAVALAVTSESAAGKVYNVGEEPALSDADWVRAVGRAAGWSGEVVAVPDGTLPRVGMGRPDWSQHLVLDTSRIRTELGYRDQVPLEEGLAQTIEWERAHPPDPPPPDPDYAAEDEAIARNP